MRICEVNGCKGIHEARGYCKRHYKSLIRWGNPLQVDINLEKRKRKEKEKEKLVRTTITRMSREGTCSVEGCNSDIKSRGMCEKHYARFRRNKGLYIKKYRYLNNECLVFDCAHPREVREYCAYHAKVERNTGSPFKAEVIKLCGVDGCRELHVAKGLCQYHYREWDKLRESVRVEDV